jgi:oligosaccharide repeat unit polymerase
MTILLLASWWAGMMLVARWICGRWFNHLSLYTCIWTASLIAFEMRLIVYHSIVFEAWLFVFVAWVALYLGTAIAAMIFPRRTVRRFPELRIKRLKVAILCLVFASFASSAILVSDIVKIVESDPITALTGDANQIYAMRFENEVSGILYVSFVGYATCALGGIYTARLGRLTVTGVLPLIAQTLDGIVSMQRAGILLGALIFASAYYFTPRAAKLRMHWWKTLLMTALILGAFLAITFNRGGAQIFAGESEPLVEAGESISVLPQLYLYASSPLACFSEYLKAPREDGAGLWGRYTLAPIYRFLGKHYGLNTYVPHYQSFYNTPESVNVGTYLREIHYDFGGSAIFLFPFCLGFIITFVERRRQSTYSIVMLSFLYTAVLFTINLNFIGSNFWYFGVPTALAVVAFASPLREQANPGSLTIVTANQSV